MSVTITQRELDALRAVYNAKHLTAEPLGYTVRAGAASQYLGEMLEHHRRQSAAWRRLVEAVEEVGS